MAAVFSPWQTAPSAPVALLWPASRTRKASGGAQEPYPGAALAFHPTWTSLVSRPICTTTQQHPFHSDHPIGHIEFDDRPPVPNAESQSGATQVLTCSVGVDEAP